MPFWTSKDKSKDKSETDFIAQIKKELKRSHQTTQSLGFLINSHRALTVPTSNKHQFLGTKVEKYIVGEIAKLLIEDPSLQSSFEGRASDELKAKLKEYKENQEKDKKGHGGAAAEPDETSHLLSNVGAKSLF